VQYWKSIASRFLIIGLYFFCRRGNQFTGTMLKEISLLKRKSIFSGNSKIYMDDTVISIEEVPFVSIEEHALFVVDTTEHCLAEK
jgi:hypothetical protein